jgi:hypothetical protein
VSPTNGRRKWLRSAGLIIGLVGVVGCSLVWFLSNNNEDFNLGFMPWTGPVTPVHWVVLLVPLLFFPASAAMAWKWQPTGGVVLIVGSLLGGGVLLLREPLMLVFYGLPGLLLVIAGVLFLIWWSEGREKRSVETGWPTLPLSKVVSTLRTVWWASVAAAIALVLVGYYVFLAPSSQPPTVTEPAPQRGQLLTPSLSLEPIPATPPVMIGTGILEIRVTCTTGTGRSGHHRNAVQYRSSQRSRNNRR